MTQPKRATKKAVKKAAKKVVKKVAVRAPAKSPSPPFPLPASPESSLRGFFKAFSPEIVAVARDARARLAARIPTANQMIYDNYQSLVIGFVPSQRPSDAVFSIVVFPNYVSLCFLQGAVLPDPDGLLRGSGKQVRQVRLASGADLDGRDLSKLITSALSHARVKFPAAGGGGVEVRAVAARKRR